ncbi:putative uncharacterized protein encoded by LINC00614 [Mytilus californianus]|uniref:putative uncharacterized protein encoded by LINC00614 n=1 Tax=Mytilus californianus TaxID=6549 RepID=UPI002245A61A|nr:putative uncharacterized protein encoded by LINC00614 [Mytilus californianus]
MSKRQTMTENIPIKSKKMKTPEDSYDEKSDYYENEETDSDDDIAIVGVGCKFPGADNIEEFWKVLYNGENHVNEIPIDRWNVEAFHSEDLDSSGKTYAKHAGLVKNFTQWDNKCFGINDTEAKEIDPQQRYVLECVHMALEDGGITRKSIKGSDTGVFIGNFQ